MISLVDTYERLIATGEATRYEKELSGKTYHIDQENMDKVLVTDYLSKTRKVISSNQHW